jgi:hypothetical protein
MNMHKRIRRALLLVTLGLGVAGCGSSVSVTTLQLGRSINADQTVANHTTTFGPHDTVYVALIATGSGAAEMGVRWTYEGRTVGEPKKQVSLRGGGATEFHLQNAGGFPPGDYAVEAFVNGQSVGTRTFHVELPR